MVQGWAVTGSLGLPVSVMREAPVVYSASLPTLNARLIDSSTQSSRQE